MKKIWFFLILFSIFCFLDPGFVSAASLYSFPAIGNISVSQTINIDVYVSSLDQAMNAVSGFLNFPADKLEVLSISKSGSIVNLWVQEPSFSNSSGFLSFEGIVLNPGFVGSGGKIISVRFRGKNVGNAKISFSNGTVLANDGNGTNILQSLTGSEINIQGLSEVPGEFNSSLTNPGTPGPADILSLTHSNPDQWYSNSNPKFSWKLESGITGVRTLLDKLPRSQPTFFTDQPIMEKAVLDVDDGIWYFHLQLRNKNGWGSISHFRIQIDTVEPEFLLVEFSEKGDEFEILPGIRVKAKDSLSGMDYYLVKLGDPVATKVMPSEIETKDYKLLVEEPGRGLVVIQGFDKAGNSRVATKEFSLVPINPPIFEEYQKSLNSGDSLVIHGSSYPNSELNFRIFRDDKELDSQSIRTDESGDFTFILADRVSSGIYKVSARVKKDDGRLSFYTEPILILVKEKAWHSLTSSFLNFIGLLTLVAGVVVMFMHFWSHFVQKGKISKEVKEAKLVVLREFGLLKQEMKKQLDLLENIKQWRELSFEETALMEDLVQILSALVKAEKLIQKEIEDIERSE